PPGAAPAPVIHGRPFDRERLWGVFGGLFAFLSENVSPAFFGGVFVISDQPTKDAVDHRFVGLRFITRLFRPAAPTAIERPVGDRALWPVEHSSQQTVVLELRFFLDLSDLSLAGNLGHDGRQHAALRIDELGAVDGWQLELDRLEIRPAQFTG